MLKKFRNWKDKGTREAILFYVSLILLFYWGVRSNFNVNELLLGAVIYVLTGLTFFGAGKDRRDQDKGQENQELALDSKPNTQRNNSRSSDNSRFKRVWVDLRNKGIRPTFQ